MCSVEAQPYLNVAVIDIVLFKSKRAGDSMLEPVAILAVMPPLVIFFALAQY